MASHSTHHAHPASAPAPAPAPAPRALTAPPHPPAVFRVLKQAWRDYMASGGAVNLAVSTPAGQAHTAVTPVSGTVTADASVPRPLQVSVSLVQSGATKATQIAVANAAGAYTTTFPANTLAAGTASVSATVAYAPAVASGTFTVT